MDIVKLRKILSEIEYKNLEKVKENGKNLKYIKTQTEELCLAAVKQYGLALQYVEN